MQYSQLELLDNVVLTNLLGFLQDSERLILRLVSKEMKRKTDRLIASNERIYELLWAFVDTELLRVCTFTFPRLHRVKANHLALLRVQCRLRDHHENNLPLLTQTLTFYSQNIHSLSITSDLTTNWRVKKIKKICWTMMIEVLLLTQQQPLNFSLTYQLAMLLEQIIAQSKTIDTDCVHNETEKFRALSRVCQTLSKASIFLFFISAFIFMIMTVFPINLLIYPTLISLCLSLTVWCATTITPILIEFSYDCIETHRKLHRRSGFVNNLHRQFEQLKDAASPATRENEFQSNYLTDEAASLLVSTY